MVHKISNTLKISHIWCQNLGKTQSCAAGQQRHCWLSGLNDPFSPGHAHMCAYKKALNSPQQSQTYQTQRTRSMPCAYSFMTPQANKSVKSLYTAPRCIRTRRFLELLKAFLYPIVRDIFMFSISIKLTLENLSLFLIAKEKLRYLVHVKVIHKNTLILAFTRENMF